MMQYLLDLPIAVKVALAPVIVGLCLVVTSASAYLTNLSTAGALGQIVHDNMPRLEQTERLKDGLLTTYATLMQSVAYEGAELKPELIAAVDSRLKANFKALHDDLDRLRAAAASRPDMAKRLEQVDQGLQRLERVAMQAIDLKGVGLGAAAVSITSSDEAFQALRQHMDEVATLEAQASQAQGALAEEAVAFGNRISLGMTLIALLLSAAVTGCLVRLITSPLADAVKIAQEVASGNLAVQAQPVGRDATGQVLAALTEVSRRLSHTIAGIRASVDEIDNASREIAQGNLDLSTRTERSSMSLQQAASTIEQLSATMRSNADAARGAREQAAQALEVAREGGGVVQGVVQTMDVINDQARRIREIIGVIDGIAFQTNILALNAAVEAARAGEQGRGFAVVAQEVRSLAGRSAEAAKEIRTLIGASVGQIEAGHQQARSAGETMLRIVGSIEQVSRRAVDIAEASAEQAQGIAHVNQTVSEMDRSTQQNAALVEQAAAATASLKQQAEGLMRAVAVFRTAA